MTSPKHLFGFKSQVQNDSKDILEDENKGKFGDVAKLQQWAKDFEKSNQRDFSKMQKISDQERYEIQANRGNNPKASAKESNEDQDILEENDEKVGHVLISKDINFIKSFGNWPRI